MKIFDKITLVLFSILILVIALVTGLLMLGYVNIEIITLLYSAIMASNVATNVILGVSAVCIILALKAIFFGGSSVGNGASGDGVLLENESGKLLISKDTIENLVNSVAQGFENTQSVTTKVSIDNQNNLEVYVVLMVLPNTVINELSANLQTRIKEEVKKVTDLDVNSIDIKIKNITTPDEKKES